MSWRKALWLLIKTRGGKNSNIKEAKKSLSSGTEIRTKRDQCDPVFVEMTNIDASTF